MTKTTAKLRTPSHLGQRVATGVMIFGASSFLVSCQTQAVQTAANDNQPGAPLPPANSAALALPANDNNQVLGGELGATIARGEGSYNSYNRGIAGDAHGRKIDFSRMSIGEIMRRQALGRGDPDRLFAVGRYQINPATMRAAVDQLDLSSETKFGPETQEKVFRHFLIATKRPAVKAFITGETRSRLEAQEALAAEFASVANPRTNHSDYGGIGGNAASISAAATGAALDEEREIYRSAIKAGKAPKDAWESLSRAYKPRSRKT